jgi:glycosyltransferase involved in cell wall biosynthesis
VIAANGKVDRWHGEDLYGLDHLVELAVRLKPDYPDVGIVICFWDFQPQNNEALDALLEKTASRGVEENILFNTTAGLFVPVLDVADLFVRPTNTDGDANSIREALYLGVPCVASNAVERPNGTILFSTRDIDDFETKVRTALASSGREHNEPKPLEMDQRRAKSYVALLKAFADGAPMVGVTEQ